jgi:dTMP kinase
LKGELEERKDGPVDPRTIAALFVADRADHLTFEIEPNLEAGVDVICDRYLHSSLAYQAVDCDPLWVAAINEPMRSPDLVLYLKVPPELAGRRRANRDDPAEIYEHDAFQRRVAAGYDAAQNLRPGDAITVVDGSGSIDEVHARCRSAVLELGSDTAADGGSS